MLKCASILWKLLLYFLVSLKGTFLLQKGGPRNFGLICWVEWIWSFRSKLELLWIFGLKIKISAIGSISHFKRIRVVLPFIVTIMLILILILNLILVFHVEFEVFWGYHIELCMLLFVSFRVSLICRNYRPNLSLLETVARALILAHHFLLAHNLLTSSGNPISYSPRNFL